MFTSSDHTISLNLSFCRCELLNFQKPGPLNTLSKSTVSVTSEWSNGNVIGSIVVFVVYEAVSWSTMK